MKKIIGLLIIAAVAVGGAIFAYQALNRLPEVTTLESIVPENVIYYAGSYNLNAKFKDFQNSDFFKQISASPFYKKFMQPKIERAMQKIPFLSELLEKDTSLSVFTLKDMTDPFNDPSGSLSDFLFLTRVELGKLAKYKKTIAEFYINISGRNSFKATGYKRVNIYSYELPSSKATIHYAFLSDVIAVSNNESIIRGCIDLLKDKKRTGLRSLKDNGDFINLYSKVDRECIFWVYGDYKRYYQEFLKVFARDTIKASRSQDPNSRLASVAAVKPFLNMVSVMQSYVSYLNYDNLKKGLVFKAYQIFDSSKEQESLLKVISSGKGVDKNTFKLSPKEAVSYYGFSYDPQALWRFFLKFSSSMDDVMKARFMSDPRYNMQPKMLEAVTFQGIIKQVEGFLNISLEKDIIPLLGNNFGVVFSGFEDFPIPMSPVAGASGGQGFSFVFPQFYLYFELKDINAMNNVLQTSLQHVSEVVNKNMNERAAKMREFQQQMAQKQQKDKTQEPEQPQEPQEKIYMQLKPDNFEGTDIYTLEMLDFPISFLRLNYCIMGKYLVVSLSPSLTKKVVSTYGGESNSLEDNLDFKSAKEKTPADSNNIMFFNFKRLVDNLRSTQFFSQLKTQAAKNPKGFNETDLNSLLDILSNINSFVFFSHMSDDKTLESTCHIKVNGL